MDEQTWINAFEIINRVGPERRIDMAVCGEPTLHPDLLRYLKVARQISPFSQIQVTTNGTQIARGHYTFEDLLMAGANIIYTDMYDPREKFIELAKKSRFPFYEYYRKDGEDRDFTPWKYYGPHIKAIVLMDPPDRWPESRLRAGLLGTWYNHLDWSASAKYKLMPVTMPVKRRCNQPFLYVTIHYTGQYLLCCQDGFAETRNLFGSVNDGGVNGFASFWFGETMQTIRRRLREKNRAGTSYCSRCNVTFSRSDFLHWTDEQVDVYYDGNEWQKMKPYDDSPFTSTHDIIEHPLCSRRVMS